MNFLLTQCRICQKTQLDSFVRFDRTPTCDRHGQTQVHGWISIQTAGLAFGGTCLCSYRLSGVEGSCAEHLTIESYTVFICRQSYLLLFRIPSPTHCFIPGLKPSFSVNPSHCSPSFLLLKYSLHGFPGQFTVISEHICFLLLVFLFLHFLVVGFVR